MVCHNIVRVGSENVMTLVTLIFFRVMRSFAPKANPDAPLQLRKGSRATPKKKKTLQEAVAAVTRGNV